MRPFIGRNLMSRPGVQLNPIWTPEPQAAPAPPAPPPPPPPPSILLSAPSPSSGLVNGPGGRGFVTLVNGTGPVPFTLAVSPLGAAVTPANGTLTPGTPVEYTVTATVANLYSIAVDNTEGIPNPAPVQYTTLNVSFTLNFEGIGTQATINNFYNGGTDSQGNSGVNYGVQFGNNALALKASDPIANFALEPSAETIMFFLDGTAILNYAPGFFTGFSFWYTNTGFTGTVNVYSGLNATGTLLGSITLAALGEGPSPGNPFSNWAIGLLEFSGTARSVDFGGTVNQVGYDNITFGSANPPIGPPAPPPPDPPPAALPDFDNVVLMLPFDGVDGSTTIIDTSSFAHAVSRFNGAFISAVNARFGQCLALPGGTGGNFFSGVRVANHPALNFDEEDFAVAFFIRPEGTAAFTPVLQKGNIAPAIELSYEIGGPLRLSVRTFGDGLVQLSDLSAPPLGQYTHIAFSRIGDMLRLFVRGRLVQEAPILYDVISNSEDLFIGANAIFNGGVVGRIDDFIVVKGEGVFEADFTPPVSPYSWL